MTDTYLLDANVLIALTVAEHEHHGRADAWLASASAFALCPVVEGGLLRFLLRIGEAYETARTVLQGVRSAPQCVFWPDSISYVDVDGSAIRGHRDVTDSYLAALARAHRGRLATFDRALAARHAEDCLLVP